MSAIMDDIAEGSPAAARRALLNQRKSVFQSLKNLFGKFSRKKPAIKTEGPAPSFPPHGMVNLRRMRVEDVAVPKAEIVAVSGETSLEELLAVFRESGLTRIPVYDGTIDQPTGMAHLKDVALKHGFSAEAGSFELQPLLRPLLYVPPSMPIGVLLTKMQTERRHMALVIDEYGGVDGLVTIEDLIEQVIGEIEDEHDVEDDALWVRERAGCWLVLARAQLDALEAECGMSLRDHREIDASEIDTLGGLIFMLAGHVPARGEIIEHPSGVSLEIVDADPRRIKRVRLRLPEQSRRSLVVSSGKAAPQTSSAGSLKK